VPFALVGPRAVAQGTAADVGLDLVDLGDAAQALGGDLGAVAVEHFLQLAPSNGPRG